MARKLPPRRTPGKPTDRLPNPSIKRDEDRRNKKWWYEEDSDGTPIVVKLLNTIILQNNNLRRLSILTWFRLYQNFQAKGLLAGDYFRPESAGRQNRLTFNLIRSAVDTMVAKTTEKEPKPTFLTTGGTWREQNLAKDLDKFCQGLFFETKFASKKAPKIVREAYIFGTGGTHIGEDDEGKVAIDPVFIEELFADELECVHGAPYSLYRAVMYSRDVALAKFRGNAKAVKLIEEAPVARVDPALQMWAEQTDLISVFEAWHLPSGALEDFTDEQKTAIADLRAEGRALEATSASRRENAAAIYEIGKKIDAIYRDGHDGRHVIATENGVLHFEAWRKRYFPIVLTHYSEPLRGYLTGTGISEELAGIQFEINKVLIQMSEALPFCVPKIMASRTAGLVNEHIDDFAMSIIRYNGGPDNAPRLLTWEAIPAQLFQQLEVLIKRGYELIGLSQMSANAEKPADLESGEALRTFDDIQSGRLYTQGKNYEEFFLDVAQMSIRVAKEIAEKNDGHYRVRVPLRRKIVKEIDWKDIDLDESAYVMQCFPTSALPRTPAGRLAMVNDLMTRGFLDKEDAIRLLNFPDLDAVNEIMEAAAEFTNWQLNKMLENGEPQQAQPYQNTAYTIRHAQAAYLIAQVRGVEETKLELLRKYIEGAKVLALKAAQPPMPPGQQPGIPGGPPTMPAPGMPVALGPGGAGAPPMMPTAQPGAAA